MASTSNPTAPTAPPELTFYSLGQRIPSGVLKREFTNTVLSTARQNFNNIVPTTYEASKIYLDEEMMKPKGQRDLQREMCMIVVMRIPSNQEVVLKLDAPKVLVPLTQGSMLLYPTVDLPPTSFGTPENKQSDILLDGKTGKPAQATIALAYFSRSGDTHDYIGTISNKVKLESSPFD